MARTIGKSEEAIYVRKLPVFPHVLLRLVEKCHLPDTSYEDLAEIIQMDPVLTARFFSISSFSESSTVANFKQLLEAMGLDTVKSVAAIFAVDQMFTHHDAGMDAFVESFWQKSLKCAFIVQNLAELINFKSSDEAYYSGLLHRIGQLVLQKKTKGEYSKLASMDLGSRRNVVERENFGVSAAEIGALLIKNWDNQSFISDAVLYQCESTNAILDASRLVKLLNLSSKLVFDDNLNNSSAIEDGQALFDLSAQQIVEVVSTAEEKVAAVMQEMKVTNAATGFQNETTHTEDQSKQPLTIKMVRCELTKRVKDIAMQDGVRQLLEKNSNLEGLLSSIQKTLFVVFGLTRSLLFLYDHGSQSLIGKKCCDQGAEIDDMKVALVSGRSLMAESVLTKTIVHSLDPEWSESISILDKQLIKLTGSKAILYLPLIANHAIIGILAIGLNPSLLSSISYHFNRMVLFASEVASAIQRHQIRAQDLDEVLESERSRREGHLKELIHEASNPLGILNNYLEVLSIQLGVDHQAQDHLHIIKEEIERVGGILTQMRETPEKEEMPVSILDLNPFVVDLVKIFRASIMAKKNIEIDLKLDQTLEPIHSHRNSLKQIFINLVKNASEAIDDTGTIQINTRGNINIDGNNFVEILVADDGPGVPDSVMDQLFHPVKSAKGKPYSGLGLTIVKDLVSDLHGSISCRSTKDVGTEFRIYIPH